MEQAQRMARGARAAPCLSGASAVFRARAGGVQDAEGHDGRARLLDLAEPRPHHRKYQLYLNKVSAKHVDFVVCSAKSEPRLVIELDDFTHDTPSRQARDEFVDTVLESCGYGVVHTRNVDRDELYPVLRRLRRTRTAGK